MSSAAGRRASAHTLVATGRRRQVSNCSPKTSRPAALTSGARGLAEGSDAQQARAALLGWSSGLSSLPPSLGTLQP
jgi:hypothetical protein